MKKGLKLTLAALMVVSVLMSFMLTASAVAVPDSYLDASNYVISDGTVSNASQPIFNNGRATFKINVSSGVTVTGALVTVKYDKKVLKIVDAGPATTTDADGNPVEVLTGMHTQGVSIGDDSAYTFAYISASGFNTGNSGKEYAYITFEVIDKTYPNTIVEFVAGDYTSTDTIKKFAGQNGNGFSTLNSGKISSFTAGKKSITVKWDSVPGATEYLVYRKGGEDATYRAIATVKNISYVDTENIKNNTVYTYAVRAKSANGYGWYEGKEFGYMDPPNITVTNSTSGVKIAWDRVEGATAYKIYRRVVGGSWEAVEQVGKDVLTITDKTISSGKAYEYTAKVIKNSYVSADADVKKIQYVAMVSNVTLANAYDGVSVKWSAVSGAEKYRIYRKVTGEQSWTVLKTVNADVLSLVDTGATSGKTNSYAVKVYSNGVWSAYKSYPFNYLASPKATKTTSTIGTGITIKWDKVPGAAQYRVYRKTSASGSWSLLTRTTATSYTDKNVSLNKSYIYTLKAENGSNLSGYNKTGWTVKYTLTTPSVTAVTPGSSSIKIQWGAVKGVDGYRVYRKAPGETSWSLLAKTSSTAYTDKNVKTGAVYTYTIRAYKGSTLSSYNTKGWVGVILKTPTVKIANYETGIKVTWSKVSGAGGYTVYSSQYNASTGKWSSWKNRGTAAASKSAWVDKTVSSGTTYRYTVKAVNGLCKGSYKASASLVYLAQPTVTISNVANGVSVKWTKATGATGYRVYRSQFDVKTEKWSSWKVMGTAAASKSAWTDKSAVDGVIYRYTVKTVSGKVMSTYKASSETMFLKVPQLLSCTADTSGNILTYESNSKADSYRIYRKTLYTGWSLIETVSGAENTVYTDKNIIDGTQYIYTVRAVNGKNVSYYDTNGISCAD
ncbi:MAG: hypothetical protein E7557_04470 [Ruminococcaceae bacterium]|nr:hypothetical protein [Oscillospiraceae bacterium]